LAQDNEIQKPGKLFYFNGLRVSSLSFAGHSSSHSGGLGPTKNKRHPQVPFV
jgi:hypothetical protein